MSILLRREPLGEIQQQMTQFRREMDRMFGRWSLEPQNWPVGTPGYPALNLREDEDAIYAEAELPGQQLEGLEIIVSGENRLTIRGERRLPTLPEGTWHRQERFIGKFERILELPVSMDAAKVEARLEQGVLTIKMAKSPQAKPRKIPVKAG